LTLTRRDFALAAGGLALELLVPRESAVAARRRSIKAVAFDAFVVFDPSSLSAEAERLYPGRGTELAVAWRTRQFEYSWLRSLTRRYVDFEQVTEDALVFASKLLRLDLPPEKRHTLMQGVLRLPTYPT
jgi:2-haloacid dehalogenase